MKDTFFCSEFRLNFAGNLREFKHPLVMGVLNVTPDSFYAESRKTDHESVIKSAQQMIEDGVDIIDVGGYSSRPGADHISEEEELKRVVSPIKEIRNLNSEVIISIDTFRSIVAQKAIESGANMINDISGGKMDPNILSVAAGSKIPYVLMHMRGTPQDMASKSNYATLANEVIHELSESIEFAKKAGILDIIVDPGFGFSKNREQNFELLNKLEYIHALGCPVLIGISRKSMIHKTLEITPEESLNGTTVLNTIALMKGVHILRVHDVKAAKECVALYERTINSSESL